MTSMNKYLPDNVMVYQLSNSVPNSSKLKIQNIISMGENSSAYESSEDTGVGELSESEFITAQDGIGMFYQLHLSFYHTNDFSLSSVLKQKKNEKKTLNESNNFNRIILILRAEIPLGDTRLLEEHDLTNVLNQLPVDAFNDLFQGKLELNEKKKTKQIPNQNSTAYLCPIQILFQLVTFFYSIYIKCNNMTTMSQHKKSKMN